MWLLVLPTTDTSATASYTNRKNMESRSYEEMQQKTKRMCYDKYNGNRIITDLDINKITQKLYRGPSIYEQESYFMAI